MYRRRNIQKCIEGGLMKVQRSQKTKNKQKSTHVKMAEAQSQRTGVQIATHGKTVHTNGPVITLM